MTRLSVVICTRNPDREILSRTFAAIARFAWPADCSAQVVLVDNGSDPALESLDYVCSWLAHMGPTARLVRETRVGLVHARLRAFRETDGDYVVFFDDDNVPGENYLLGIVEAVSDYPFVGVWGPGRVEVVWLPGADPRVVSFYASRFQEHSQSEVTYALDFPLPATTPFGTGMVVRREVAIQYESWYRAAPERIPGRSGNALTGWEDVQISWLAMLRGWAIGRHPALQVQHVIPARRAQLEYLARLIYGSDASYAPALREVLGDRVRISSPSRIRLALHACTRSLVALVTGRATILPVMIAPLIGDAVGAWTVNGAMPPRWVRSVVARLYEPKVAKH